MEIELYPLGDQAIVAELGTSINLTTHNHVQQFISQLDRIHPDWMIEYIPAFTTVTIFYDPLKIHDNYLPDSTTLPYNWVYQQVLDIAHSAPAREQSQARTIEIPVCYGEEFGPDLDVVAKRSQLQPEEVIDLHTAGDYLVYMIGFAPGFPYLGGMDEAIATPRRKDPRQSIPAGSVGIAGGQTGVYPIETPGGWQLIGRTPFQLFQPQQDPPSLLLAGDRIKFKAISKDEFKKLEEEQL